MSVRLDAAIVETGTRFRLYAQPPYASAGAFMEPETVRVAVSAGGVRAGPSDDRMHVVDAINKYPYAVGEYPPYTGPANAPVAANATGHFDHLQPGTRAFSCATMYATVRRVLDIFSDYAGGEIPWHFAQDFARMELIPLVNWNNAHSGYGFLEFGYGEFETEVRPYCENFDVLAHETGHSIVFSLVGVPTDLSDAATVDFWAFHESAADLVAIVSSLHFDSVVAHLLAQTRGNLFTINELDRVGELSQSTQIRNAFNYARMSDVGDEPHERSLPLTGAVFDVLVEDFQKRIVAGGQISQQLADASNHTIGSAAQGKTVQSAFDAAYAADSPGFRRALLASRDYFGALLSTTWRNLSPNGMEFRDVCREMLRADIAVGGGVNAQTIRDCFAWREISIAVAVPAFAKARSLVTCGMSLTPGWSIPRSGRFDAKRSKAKKVEKVRKTKKAEVER